MDVSVVLLTCNSSMHVSRTIQAILYQTFNNFELIIVDDGSTDDTVEHIKRWNDKRIVLIQNQTNLGIAASRTIGSKHAKGKYVFFTDSDCIPIPTWLESGYKAINKGFDIVTGWTLYENPYPSLSDRVVQGKDEYFTCNLGFRKSKMKQVGYFRLKYNMYCEDKDLCFRMLKKGAKKIYTDDMIVIHQYNPRTPKGEWKIYSNYLVNKLRIYLDHDMEVDGIIFRVIKPMYLIYALCPITLFHFAFFRLRDFYILPFMWFGLIRGRIDLWRECWRQKVFYI